jgi:hypothetical protein
MARWTHGRPGVQVHGCPPGGRGLGPVKEQTLALPLLVHCDENARQHEPIPNLNIGCNVEIGAGSTVIRDVPSNVTVVGSPAKAT